MVAASVFGSGFDVEQPAGPYARRPCCLSRAHNTYMPRMLDTVELGRTLSCPETKQLKSFSSPGTKDDATYLTVRVRRRRHTALDHLGRRSESAPARVF